jgi:hypothetical protein
MHNNVNTSLNRREELVTFLVMLARRWRLAGRALSRRLNPPIDAQGVTAAGCTLATELAAAPCALDWATQPEESRTDQEAPHQFGTLQGWGCAVSSCRCDRIGHRFNLVDAAGAPDGLRALTSNPFATHGAGAAEHDGLAGSALSTEAQSIRN